MDKFRKTRWEYIKDAMLILIASTIFGFGFSVGTTIYFLVAKLAVL